jgi:hypothetical protein
MRPLTACGLSSAGAGAGPGFSCGGPNLALFPTKQIDTVSVGFVTGTTLPQMQAACGAFSFYDTQPVPRRTSFVSLHVNARRRAGPFD